jgi:hypothetical protein
VLTADGSMREMLCACHRRLINPGEGHGYGCVTPACSVPLAEAMLPFSIVDLGEPFSKQNR